MGQFHDDVGSTVGLEKIEDPNHGRGATERRQCSRFFEKALAAPDEFLGMFRRAWQDSGGAISQRERARQVFLDGDVTI